MIEQIGGYLTHMDNLWIYVYATPDYEDPAEEQKELIRKTKEELTSEEPKEIISDSNFGKYQQTKQMLVKARDISKHDFNVSDNYKKILLHQLKKTIDYLNKIMEEIE